MLSLQVLAACFSSVLYRYIFRFMKSCFAFASLVAATIFVAPLQFVRVARADDSTMQSANVTANAMDMIDIVPATYRAGDDSEFW
ncbi:MAG: hypothetical protein ACR2MB_16590, partial [Acidimicrobiales bacterium]